MINQINKTNLANEVRVKLLQIIKDELKKKSLENKQLRFLKNLDKSKTNPTKKNDEVNLSKENYLSSDDDSMNTCNVTPEIYENHPSFKNSSFPLNKFLHNSTKNSPIKSKARKRSIVSCDEIIINNRRYILKNTSKYLSTFLIESKK